MQQRKHWNDLCRAIHPSSLMTLRASEHSSGSPPASVRDPCDLLLPSKPTPTYIVACSKHTDAIFLPKHEHSVIFRDQFLVSNILRTLLFFFLYIFLTFQRHIYIPELEDRSPIHESITHIEGQAM